MKTPPMIQVVPPVLGLPTLETPRARTALIIIRPRVRVGVLLQELHTWPGSSLVKSRCSGAMSI